MKTVKASVDRIEEGVAVIITDDAEKYEVSAEEYGLSANDIVNLTLDNGEIKALVKDDEEREKRLKKNTERLRSLFGKKK